jgi:DNA helicase-2/ATP-dependent DNA helicase PcrA
MPAPSPEQQAYRSELLASNDSILLEAVAGSGKTTTLVQNLDALKGSICLMAFNKKIAEELKERVARLPVDVQLNTEVGTVHSLGLAALRNAGFKPRVAGGKVSFLLKDLIPEGHPHERSRRYIKDLVSYAKANAFDVQLDHAEYPRLIDAPVDWMDLIEHFNMEVDFEDAGLAPTQAIRYAQQVLKQSNQQLTIVDFDDMLYLPLLLNLKLKQFANVLIDEAQDTNLVRRELAFRMLRPNGRLIAVGDPHQAIYGFTGADANALNNIASRANAKRMALSVCWRCDEKIIAHARNWVKHITSWDTEGRGSVSSIPFDEKFLGALRPGDAVLCRLNKPNVSVAIALLRRGVTARIEGRDLGERLLSHARKAAPDCPPLDELAIALESYLEHQTMLLAKHEKGAQIAMLEDEVDALQVLIERCLEQGRKQFFHLDMLAKELFQDDAHKQKCVLLSSIHKSKGLEWPRVYLLGRSDYMPFHKATFPWELEQETNLIYVAVTRATHELIEVTGVQAALDKGVHRKAVGASEVKQPGENNLTSAKDCVTPDEEAIIEESYFRNLYDREIEQ